MKVQTVGVLIYHICAYDVDYHELEISQIFGLVSDTPFSWDFHKPQNDPSCAIYVEQTIIEM